MEKTLCIPAILANKIKEREQNKGVQFNGSPNTIISNNVTFIKKGMKYYLSGEERDVISFISSEPDHIKKIVASLNPGK